jgi:hypothetical protein
MPIDGGGGRSYVLGRECRLTIEGREIKGASDVARRNVNSTIDGTYFNANVQATIPVLSDVEISFSCPDMDDAQYVRSMRWKKVGKYFIPRVVTVEMEGGVFDQDVYRNDGWNGSAEYPYIIHEIESDEPVNGAVIPRFTLRRWNGETRNVQ